MFANILQKLRKKAPEPSQITHQSYCYGLVIARKHCPLVKTEDTVSAWFKALFHMKPKAKDEGIALLEKHGML